MTPRSPFGIWIHSYRLLWRHGVVLMGLSFLMSYGFTIGWALLKGAYLDFEQILPQLMQLHIPAVLIWGLLILVTQGLWWGLMLPSMIFATSSAAQGHAVTAALVWQRKNFRQIKESFGVLNWMALLIAGGIILIILPGIWMTVVFCLSLQVYGNEDIKGLAALQRSRDLVKGHFWATLWLLVLAYGGNSLLVALIKPAYTYWVVHPVGLELINGLLETVLAPVPYLALALWHQRLVNDKLSAVYQQGVTV